MSFVLAAMLMVLMYLGLLCAWFCPIWMLKPCFLILSLAIVFPLVELFRDGIEWLRIRKR